MPAAVPAYRTTEAVPVGLLNSRPVGNGRKQRWWAFQYRAITQKLTK